MLVLKNIIICKYANLIQRSNQTALVDGAGILSSTDVACWDAVMQHSHTVFLSYAALGINHFLWRGFNNFKTHWGHTILHPPSPEEKTLWRVWLLLKAKCFKLWIPQNIKHHVWKIVFWWSQVLEERGLFMCLQHFMILWSSGVAPKYVLQSWESDTSL